MREKRIKVFTSIEEKIMIVGVMIEKTCQISGNGKYCMFPAACLSLRLVLSQQPGCSCVSVSVLALSGCFHSRCGGENGRGLATMATCDSERDDRKKK